MQDYSTELDDLFSANPQKWVFRIRYHESPYGEGMCSLHDIPCHVFWVWTAIQHSYLGTLAYRAAAHRETDTTWSLWSSVLSLPAPFYLGEDEIFHPVLVDVQIPLRLEHLLFDLRVFFLRTVSVITLFLKFSSAVDFMLA